MANPLTTVRYCALARRHDHWLIIKLGWWSASSASFRGGIIGFSISSCISLEGYWHLHVFNLFNEFDDAESLEHQS